jgi:hypothetical protein
MSLNLNKNENYTNSYDTNWGYLNNMTDLQMKALEKITWYGHYIHTNLMFIPWARFSNLDAKKITEAFIKRLNEDIMGL